MKNLTYKLFTIFGVVLGTMLLGCSMPQPGPDKQGSGMVQGAISGGATGAVYGVQIGALTGPAIGIGAGIGAVAGAVQGAMVDSLEENQHRIGNEIDDEMEIARAQEVLAEHYKRRIAMHPTRDIYPADWFFDGDSVKLKPSAKYLVREIAKLNYRRLPWSRLVIASYSKSKDPHAQYPIHIASARAREIANYMIASGIEPRRIDAKAIITPAPVLIDDSDRVDRYSQAIEIIPIDR